MTNRLITRQRECEELQRCMNSNEKDNDKYVRNVAKMLRHSIDHNNFNFDYRDGKVSTTGINEIEFINRGDQLEMRTTYEQFKKFVIHIAHKALELMQQ